MLISEIRLLLPMPVKIWKTKTASGIEIRSGKYSKPNFKTWVQNWNLKGFWTPVFCIMLRNPRSKTLGCELTIWFLSGLFLFISFGCLFLKPRKLISLYICFGLSWLLFNHCSFCCCLKNLVVYKGLYGRANLMTEDKCLFICKEGIHSRLQLWKYRFYVFLSWS